MTMKTATTDNVEALTRQGTELFEQGKLSQAIATFEATYRQATQLNDASCICNCAFNLGAVYIANRQPEKGLAMLNNALPCTTDGDNTLKADLYYNFGLAYELLGNREEAVKYLELALEEYHKEPDKTPTEADLAAKIADVYTNLNNAPQAARNHQVAAVLYAQIAKFDEHVVQLCKQATRLLQGGKVESAKEVSDSCMVSCHAVKASRCLGEQGCLMFFV